MVKKVIVIVGIILVLIVGGYLGYKSYVLKKYDLSNLGNSYPKILEKINNKNKV